MANFGTIQEAVAGSQLNPIPTAPVSNVASPTIGVIEAAIPPAPTGKSCLDRYDFLQRLQLQLYESLPLPVGGHLPYVFSDTVAVGKWRVVMHATADFRNPTLTPFPENNPVALYLLPPLPSSMDKPYDGSINGSLFLDYKFNTSEDNKPALALGIRIDEMNVGNTNGSPNLNPSTSSGQEVILLSRPKLIPPGWRLMLVQMDGGSHGVGDIIQLRLGYVDLFNNEELSFEL